MSVTRVTDDAEKAVAFFETYLEHVEGEWAGHPFIPAAWQREILAKVFGVKDESGLRRYRTVYIEIPRKNGKSSFAAGLALKCLVADNEPGGQVYVAAQNRQQAGIIFRVAAEMVLRNAELRESCDVLQSVKRILFPRTGSFLQVLPGDSLTAHGINASAIIFDELHTQKNRALYEVLKTSQGARRQPLFVMLTTAGYDDQSLWGTERDYALKVREGIIQDDSYLPVLYGAAPKDDWQDPAVWKKANPSWDDLGKTFQDFIAKEAKRAADSPVDLNAFLRLHLNIPTKQEIRWMPMDAWDASTGLVVEGDLKGRRCYGGLDIANTNDLAAWAMVFPPKDGDPDDSGVYEVLVRFWVPSDAVPKRVRVSRVPYDLWVAEGFIKTTEGAVIDYAAIRQQILRDRDAFDVAQVNYDPWNAGQIVQDLTGEGMTCVQMQQGFRLLSAPTKELLRLILAKRLRHGSNPVLRWNADNLIVRQDPYNNIRPDKERSREKIDGAVALIMALDAAMRNRSEPSVYASRGIISV